MGSWWTKENSESSEFKLHKNIKTKINIKASKNVNGRMEEDSDYDEKEVEQDAKNGEN